MNLTSTRGFSNFNFNSYNRSSINLQRSLLKLKSNMSNYLIIKKVKNANPKTMT
jgi:hypothetical protein